MKGRKKAEACGNTVTNQVTKKMRGDGMAELSGKPKVLYFSGIPYEGQAGLFIAESGCPEIEPVYCYLA